MIEKEKRFTAEVEDSQLSERKQDYNPLKTMMSRG